MAGQYASGRRPADRYPQLSGCGGAAARSPEPATSARKVLLPVGTIARVDHLERVVHVDRTREQVKESPAFDPDAFGEPDYRHRVGSYYEESYRRG